MSTHSASHAGAEHGEVFEQYQSLEQQQETYIVGMWSFLVTEVMFFGALFLIYTVYRWKYQPYFHMIHHELDLTKGAINTVVLLSSSLSMALAVHYAQLKNKMKQLQCLGFTLLCAMAFLVIKYLEYSHKFEVHHFPGATFDWHPTPDAHGLVAPSGVAQVFFSLYFAMTGLHGVHVLVGILLIGTLAWLVFRDSPYVKNDYIPTEMIGLYWHFVDLVWIFLFPLFYLMPQ